MTKTYCDRCKNENPSHALIQILAQRPSFMNPVAGMDTGLRNKQVGEFCEPCFESIKEFAATWPREQYPPVGQNPNRDLPHGKEGCDHEFAYYAVEHDNWYCKKCNKGMGDKFYEDNKRAVTANIFELELP